MYAAELAPTVAIWLKLLQLDPVHRSMELPLASVEWLVHASLTKSRRWPLRMVCPAVEVRFVGAGSVGVVAALVLEGPDTTAPLVVMLASYWLVGVPVSAYLGFRTTLGASGLWWGFVVSLAAVAVFLFLRIRVVFRGAVKRVLVEEPHAG